MTDLPIAMLAFLRCGYQHFLFN